MKRDPRIRKDGQCALKTCRKLIVMKRQRGVPDYLYQDPFCSNICARAWHGWPMLTRQENNELTRRDA